MDFVWDIDGAGYGRNRHARAFGNLFNAHRCVTAGPRLSSPPLDEALDGEQGVESEVYRRESIGIGFAQVTNNLQHNVQNLLLILPSSAFYEVRHPLGENGSVPS